MATKYILQEWNDQSLPCWRNIDGTVRDTYIEVFTLWLELIKDNYPKALSLGKYCSHNIKSFEE